MVAKVILNPYAGRWKALKFRQSAENALLAAGIKYDIELTEGPRHATRISSQAVQQDYDLIIAAGGDGTISEIVNGMMKAPRRNGGLPKLGIIPLGSANDLVVNLGLPLDIENAAHCIANDQVRRMDLGQVTYYEDSQSDQPTGTQYFDNNSAIGLEPSITLIQQRIHRIQGSFRYVLAALMGIAQNPQWTMTLEWDSGNYSGPATLVTVGNHPLTGGVFYMTPHANGFDEQLTFVYGAIPTRLKILSILPKTMKPAAGSYVEHPDIHEFNTSSLVITTNRPTPLHADGEIQSVNVTRLEYKVLPHVLPVLVKS